MAKTDTVRQTDLQSARASGGAVYLRGGAGGVSNADTVDGFHAAAVPTPGYLLALNALVQFPTSVLDWSSVAGVGLQESPADKLAIKLDTNSGLAVSASGLKLSFGGGNPTAIEPDDAAGQGTQPYAARADHRHAITVAAPGTIQPDHTASEGTSTSFARADHRHAIVAEAPSASLTYATTNAEGTSTSFARADHQHAITAYADADVYPQHLLKSDSLGDLKLHMLTATDRLRATLIDSPTGTGLSIAPAEDISLSPGNTKRVKATTGVRLQSDGYVSQTTGWAIAFNGAADFRYVYTDELHAKAFIADLEQALAGGQIISKSVAPLSRDFTAPAAGGTADLWVECFQGFADQEVFQTGDIVMVRSFDRSGGGLDITNCFGTVSAPYFPSPQSEPPEQRWTFTRLSGTVNGHPAAGYMMANSVVKRGALALDFGTTGMGYHEVNAIDGLMGENSPYNQTVKWAQHPWYDRTVTTRTGNLKGIFNVAGEYGLYAGEGAATADKYLRVSNQAIEGHNLPIRLYDGPTQVVRIEPGTYPYIGLGNPAPTAYLGATGIWMGKHSTAYKMHVGTVSGGDVTAGWKWDGSTLTVRGNIYVGGGNAAKVDLSNVAANTVVGKVNTTGATLIQPGRILISGSTTLDGWRYGNTTYIDGGDIYTGTVTASKMTVTTFNLVDNPGFEYGGSWSFTANAGRTGTYVRTGNWCAVAEGTGVGHYPVTSSLIPVRAGATYYFEGWIYHNAGGSPYTTWWVHEFDASDAWLRGERCAWSSASALWVKHSRMHTVGSNCAYIRVQWYLGADCTPGNWYRADDVVLREASGMNVLVGVPGGARVEINNAGIEGYSDLTTKQFYLRTSDGRAMFGEGNCVLDSGGLRMDSDRTTIQTYNSIEWRTDPTNPSSTRGAYISSGLYYSGAYPDLRLYSNPDDSYANSRAELRAHGSAPASVVLSQNDTWALAALDANFGPSTGLRVSLNAFASNPYISFGVQGTDVFQVWPTELRSYGDAWFVGDVSAASFTDRTPYPDRDTALAAVRSLRQAEGKAGSLDHEALHEYVRARDEGGEMGRNLSATVSAQNVVIQELLGRIELLEKDRRVS